MSDNPLVFLGAFLAITCMTALPAIGAGHVITLDDRVGRVIYLEAIDEWCTITSDHKIDYDALRSKLAHEQGEAWKLAASERELRTAYNRQEVYFRLSNTNPTFFCETMYRLRNQQGYEMLTDIFEN